MRRSTTCLPAALFAATLLAAPFTGAAGAHPAAAIADTNRPAADTARDAARKPAALMAFAHVDHGTKVADFIPGSGYWTRLFAVAVKPGGSVVAIIPAAAAENDQAAAAAVTAMGTDKAYGDVTVVASPVDPAATNLDVFWTAQNYHDLHNAPAGTVEGINRAVFAMLKPGGYYVIVDHAAAAGAPADVTNKLHRIDPAVVKAEVTAAGFVFDGASTVLTNPGDDHGKNVFDPSVRGKTDQFAFRFKKPG